ncbi:hypothetical protein EXS71_02995 [Candidatus Uhrbacteria bacterium]|nr:hypothetical protein [Candidatus Uhrbacteria bacterium]
MRYLRHQNWTTVFMLLMAGLGVVFGHDVAIYGYLAGSVGGMLYLTMIGLYLRSKPPVMDPRTGLIISEPLSLSDVALNIYGYGLTALMLSLAVGGLQLFTQDTEIGKMTWYTLQPLVFPVGEGLVCSALSASIGPRFKTMEKVRYGSANGAAAAAGLPVGTAAAVAMGVDPALIAQMTDLYRQAVDHQREVVALKEQEVRLLKDNNLFLEGLGRLMQNLQNLFGSSAGGPGAGPGGAA